ncbi:MAG: DUF5640 domain-containing protein [Muribaculaceae bacterium]
MKKLKFLAMLLMAMTLSLGFTSCSDDDDDDASDIIGTWKHSEYDWEETYTFNENGTFLWTEDDYWGKYYESGTYKYDKKSLVLSFDDEDEPDYYQVVSNSGTSMVLKYISDSSDGDVEVWTRVK